MHKCFQLLLSSAYIEPFNFWCCPANKVFGGAQGAGRGKNQGAAKGCVVLSCLRSYTATEAKGGSK